MDELTALMSFLRKQPSLGVTSLAERRAAYDRAEKAFPLPAGMASSPWAADGLAGERIAAQDAASGRTVLYLHGGGYGIGSPRSHRHLAAAIAQAAHAEALLPDYRLAPEHPFPAALDDAVTAYRHVLKHTPAAQVAVVGDSAGGGLTIATLLAARDAGLAMPAAAVCLSPWVI
jgi:monoterpene epsilon-lactone hydrolase